MKHRDIVIHESRGIGQEPKRILLRIMDTILVAVSNHTRGGVGNETAYLCKDPTQQGNVRIVKPNEIKEIRS